MAKMCPMSGCQGTHGMCIHDKMMFGMVALMVAASVGHWVLHLF